MRKSTFIQMVLAATAGLMLTSLPVLAAGEPAAQPDTASSVQAVWAPRHVTFVYQGFTTHYSCDGLRDEIHRMLAKLGAHDLKVSERGCTNLVGVDPFPGVHVTMEVLVPASSKEGGKTAPIAAHWHKVVLLASNSSFEAQGNCELIEQFKETFLPLFSTRNISYNSNCVPHQLTLGTHLSTEVLVPDTAPAHGW